VFALRLMKRLNQSSRSKRWRNPPPTAPGSRIASSISLKAKAYIEKIE
jgi:hypothetical protein